MYDFNVLSDMYDEYGHGLEFPMFMSLRKATRDHRLSYMPSQIIINKGSTDSKSFKDIKSCEGYRNHRLSRLSRQMLEMQN